MNCTGKRCLMQYGKVDPETCQCVSYCPQATPPKTNADRIRSMTDEELARILSEGCHGTIECPNCCGEYTGTIKSCTECWLEWLKEEVKE